MQDIQIDAPASALARPFGPVGQRLLQLARFMALSGVAALMALVLLSLVSIVGRKLLAAPVPGDVEVLQMVGAGALASFFGYCHLQGGDVKVDFFTQKASPRAVYLMDSVGSLLVGLFGALLAWRTAAGAMGLYEVAETSTILAWPLWVAQAAAVPGFVLLALAGLYMAVHQWLSRAALAQASTGGAA